MPNGVDAEAVDSALEPKAHYVVDRRAHFRIAPVQIWLCRQEGVVVVLAGCLVEFPGVTPEFGEPVVRRTAIRGRVAPDIPVTLGILARRAALLEPGMPIRGVVGHEIEQQLEPARMCG